MKVKPIRLNLFINASKDPALHTFFTSIEEGGLSSWARELMRTGLMTKTTFSHTDSKPSFRSSTRDAANRDTPFNTDDNMGDRTDVVDDDIIL